MSSLPACAGGAEATLTNWEGHFLVENSENFAALGYASVGRSHADNCNGYAAAATTTKHNCLELSDAGDDNEDDDDDNDVDDNWQPRKAVSAAVCETNEQSRRKGSRTKRQPPPGHYSSPSRNSGGDHSHIDSSRLGLFSRQTTRSSLLADSMTDIRVEDLQNESEPTSALLGYCKRKFLRPYLAILSVVALNPISTDTTICRSGLSYMQACLVLMLLVFGYILQYFCSYRGDRGFSNYSRLPSLPPDALLNVTRTGAVRTIGELIFGHVIPNVLHMCGYVSAVIVCKLVGQEQLQNLIERAFLMSMQPRRLCRMLWLYVASGFLLFSLLFGYVVPAVLMQNEIMQFHWLSKALAEWKATTKLTLLVTLFMQDLVEIVVLTSYCIECYLLRVHLATLSHKLIMHAIESQEWMREMLEFRKLLDHLNQLISIPVCFFVVMNLAYAFAGFVYLFNDFDFHYSALKIVVLNIVNVLLWLVMGLVPFFMAASVTRVCQQAKDNGHQIRVRPFVYQNTATEDLNSTLLFASTLDLSAKLFRMPIQSNYLCFAILVVSIVILTLGMCVNLIDLGNF